MSQCRKPKPRRSETDSKNKNRWAAFSKNRVPVLASPEQIQRYEDVLDTTYESDLTLYELFEPFSHLENGECGKLVVLTHLLYRLQDLDIALICANSCSEQLLFHSLSDRGLKYQTISSLLPEKESFGIIVKLRKGCLDDDPVTNTAVDLIIAYDGAFEYSAEILKQFRQPHTQEKHPMIQLITMDTSESRSRTKLYKYLKYNDTCQSLYSNELELLFKPTRTSWCHHFTDWNEYVAEDILLWLVSANMDYKFQFPSENSPLNEIYQEELRERKRQTEDKFRIPRGNGAWNDIEGHLRPRLMQALPPNKQHLIRKHMEMALATDMLRLPRKEKSKAAKSVLRPSSSNPSVGSTNYQSDKEINQPSATALKAIERFNYDFYNSLEGTG